MPVWVTMALIFVFVVSLDVWLMQTDRETYSQRVRFWARVWAPSRLLITAAMGALIGHWYW